jgi:TonB-linked SusC/RagA family outer membrane protein
MQNSATGKYLPRVTFKMLLIMKLLIVFILGLGFQVHAHVAAQTVSLTEKNAPLEKIFKEIRRQSGYEFLYGARQLQAAPNVNVTLVNVPLETALKEVLKNTPFTYTIQDKTIVIRPKPQVDPASIGVTANAIEPLPIDIKGTVKDEAGKPVVGASVQVKGTNKGTTTNNDGEFALAGVDDKATLVISAVNIETREVGVNGRSEINLVAKAKVSKLEDVEITAVNTGYQSIPKERATGSFVQIDNQLLNRSVTTKIIDRLQGIVSGMAFNKSDAIGNGEISIRGRSTILANATPLIVVDNFPYEGSIDNINPNDVESITILKDAAAASIWGTRAANGVIVITTKKGRFNQRSNLEFNSSISVGGKPDLFSVKTMTSSEVIDVERMLFSKGYYNSDLTNTSNYPKISPVVELLQMAKTGQISQADADNKINAFRQIDNRNDLMNYAYHNSINQQYSLNMSGGAANMSYYLSGGYNRDISQVKGINDRITLVASNTFSPFKQLLISATLSVIQSNTAEGIFPSEAGTIYPYERLIDVNGKSLAVTNSYRNSFIERSIQNGFLDWKVYPFADASLNDNKTGINDNRLTLNTKYKMNSWLSFDLTYQLQKQYTDSRDYNNPNSYFVRDYVNQFSQVNPVTGLVTARPVPLGGIVDNSTGKVVSNNGRVQFNVDQIWDKHRVTVIGGYEVRQTRSTAISSRLYGYDPDIEASKTVNYDSSYLHYPAGFRDRIFNRNQSTSESLDRSLSMFINAAYTYAGKYTMSGSMRKDESNSFGVKANQRGIPLWSAGFKWDINKESFYKLKWLPYLSMRFTYGYNGNINRNLVAYTTASYYVNEFNLPNATISTPPNANLRWERVQTINLGIDFKTRNQGIYGSVEFYKKHGTDLTGTGGLDPTSGFLTYRGNFANMTGNGIDLQLSFNNRIGPIDLKTHFLLSYNTDKVTAYNDVPVISSMLQEGSFVPRLGYSIYSVYSLQWAGLDPSNGDPQGILNNQVSKDYAKLNAAISDVKYNGPGRPQFFGSLRNDISWKGITVSANIIYKLDYYFRRTSINYPNLYSQLIGHSDYATRWQKQGDELSTNVPSMVYPIVSPRESFYRTSEVLVERGDHIRLQDISISYNLDRLSREKLWIKRFEIYMYLNNISIIWKKNNVDVDPDYQRVPTPPLNISFGLRASL